MNYELLIWIKAHNVLLPTNHLPNLLLIDFIYILERFLGASTIQAYSDSYARIRIRFPTGPQKKENHWRNIHSADYNFFHSGFSRLPSFFGYAGC